MNFFSNSSCYTKFAKDPFNATINFITRKKILIADCEENAMKRKSN